jgi:large subunit ribosomal protein L5
MIPRLKEDYQKRIQKEFLKEFKMSSIMAVPKIQKVILNAGLGIAVTDSAVIDEVTEIFSLISGQKPVTTKAKRAISAFKIREGLPIGVKVTLRGPKMWEFLDKLVNVVLPRTKDFHGLDPKAFDQKGTYSIGIREHTVFPEIDPNKVQKIRNFQIVVVTNAKKSEDAKNLLIKFGFPFAKNG